MKNLISIKIINILKNLENKIQNKPSYMDDEGKNKEILMVMEIKVWFVEERPGTSGKISKVSTLRLIFSKVSTFLAVFL